MARPKPKSKPNERPVLVERYDEGKIVLEWRVDPDTYECSAVVARWERGDDPIECWIPGPGGRLSIVDVAHNPERRCAFMIPVLIDMLQTLNSMEILKIPENDAIASWSAYSTPPINDPINGRPTDGKLTAGR